MKIFNLLWILPLYSFLLYEIGKTIRGLFKGIIKIYSSIGFKMALLPSFYFWLTLYIVSILYPLCVMAMILGTIWKDKDTTVKHKIIYIVSLIIIIFVLNIIIGFIEPYAYPLFVDKEGYERMRLIPFIPPVKG